MQEAAASLLESRHESCLNLLLRKLGAVKAIENVVFDRAREKTRLLLHDSELLLMVPLGVNLLNVLLVKENLAVDGVVEALDKGDDGGLAAARVADKCHGLAVLHINVDALEDGDIRLGGVVELDV